MRSSTAEVTSKLNLDGSPTSPAHSEHAQIVTYKRVSHPKSMHSIQQMGRPISISLRRFI
jgi:hypothetical protein